MIAVTAISSYLYCPRKLYLERVLKLVKPPKEAIIKGTIRHETYDLINKAEEALIKSIKTDNIKYILQSYKQTYSQILKKVIIKNKDKIKSVNLELSEIFRESWRYVINEAKTRTFNTYSFIVKHKVFGDELWDKITPKIKSELRIESSMMQLRGIVDQIEYFDDNIIPYELKTGKMPDRGVWPGHKIQMAAYIMMLREQTGFDIKLGNIKYLDCDETRPVLFNEFLEKEVIDLRDKTISVLNSKELPSIVENRNKCKACELRDKCYSMQCYIRN